MPRRRRSSSRYPASRDPYYDALRYRRPRRNGCLTDIQDFFTNLLRVVVLIAITGFVLFFTITRFQQVLALFTTLFSFVSLLISILPRLLSIAFFVGCALVALAIVYWVVSLLSSISERHAIASETRAHAKQERQRAEHEQLRAEQQRVQVEQQRVKLLRDRQAAADEHERRRIALAQTAQATARQQHPPHATHLLTDDPVRRHSRPAPTWLCCAGLCCPAALSAPITTVGCRAATGSWDARDASRAHRALSGDCAFGAPWTDACPRPR